MSLCFTFEGKAQWYVTSTYTVADGLASSIVHDIAQDSSGIIWLATRTGVSSFNGIKFRNYNISSGLPSSGYRYVHVDEMGKRWAVQDIGLLSVLCLEGDSWNQYPLENPGFSAKDLVSFEVIYRSGKPILVFGHAHLGVFLLSQGKFTRLHPVSGSGIAPIRQLACCKDLIYVVGVDTLFVYDFPGKGGRVKPIKTLKIDGLLSLGLFRNFGIQKTEKVWLLGNNWLGALKGEKLERFQTDRPFHLGRMDYPFFIVPVDGGDCYFGSNYHVFHYSRQGGKVEEFGRDNGLVTDGANSVMQDREKNMWFASSRGVSKLSSLRFVNYATRDRLSDNEVASGIEIEMGSYVFGHHGSLTFFDGKDFSLFPLLLPVSLPYHDLRILEIAKDKEKNLWIAASEAGLGMLSPSRQLRWYGAKDGLHGRVYSVVVNSSGQVWVSTNRGLFLKEKQRFHRVPVLIDTTYAIRKIFLGGNDELYLLGYNNGIIEKKGEREIHYAANGNSLANSVFSFFQDDKGRRWVGTSAGLCLLRADSLSKVMDGSLRIDNPTYAMTQDKMGRMWFGTDNGVFRWDGSDLVHFTTRDGLAGLDVNRSALFADANNHIWIGTNNGLSVYRPEYEYDLATLPRPLVALLHLEEGGRNYHLGRALSFSSKENDLVFYFQVSSFIDEKQVYYKYMLEGLDQDWSQEFLYFNDHCRYSNLPPGKYRFCLKARNVLGVWSEAVCSEEIRIRQPFYFQAWFMLLFTLLGGMMVFFLGRLVFTQRYNNRLERLVNDRTAKLIASQQQLKETIDAKDSFFSIIAHDLRSPFNALLGMLELLTDEKRHFSDKEYRTMLLKLRDLAERTFNLLENLLTWARLEKGVVPHDPSRLNLEELIGEALLLNEPAAMSKNIRLGMEVLVNCPVMADRNMISTVLRNLISNAIKYSNPGSEVSIRLAGDQGQVVVSVRDQGVGMDEKSKSRLFLITERVSVKGTSNETGTGMGLILCKEFVEKNNGKIWVLSEPGKGSTFLFSLPCAP